jgi:DNA-directed RNA polymerase beta' subunit
MPTREHAGNDPGDQVRLSLATADDIRHWAFAEVRRPETVQPLTGHPEKSGLFSESIFGREQDWECSCGASRGREHVGQVCAACGDTVGRPRWKRLSVIELASPAIHFWLRGPLACLLGLSQQHLLEVLYFANYIVIDPGDTPLRKQQVITEDEFRRFRDQFGQTFQVDLGPEALRRLLEEVRLDALAVQLRHRLRTSSHSSLRPRERRRLANRLRLVELLRSAGLSEPADLVRHFTLDCVPVLPPGLRPLPARYLSSRRVPDYVISHGLNDFYLRILNHSNRLARLEELNAPEVILRNERRMAQQAVEALLDNARLRRPVRDGAGRPVPSLADRYRGEGSRWRRNLLSKRVDYSGVAVVVPDPRLEIDQCGLPIRVAVTLYEPFLLGLLIRQRGDFADRARQVVRLLAPTPEGQVGAAFLEGQRRYRTLLAELGPALPDLLTQVFRSGEGGRPLLVSAQPVRERHRLLCLRPVPVAGEALYLAPQAMRLLNIRGSGERVRLHLPVRREAQAEATLLLAPQHQRLHSADGSGLWTLTSEARAGCIHLTVSGREVRKPVRVFAHPREVAVALQAGRLELREGIRVRLGGRRRVWETGSDREGFVAEREVGPEATLATTPGRLLFDEAVGAPLPFCNLPLDASRVETLLADALSVLSAPAFFALLARLEKVGCQARLQAGSSGGEGDGEGEPASSGTRGGSRGWRFFQTARQARRTCLLRREGRRKADRLLHRLVDLVQSVVVTEEDCGTHQGSSVGTRRGRGRGAGSLVEAIQGRVACGEFEDPAGGGLIVGAGELIGREAARQIEDLGIERVLIRSPLHCQAARGVCRLCYGADPATGQLVEPGKAVGVQAAQALAGRAARLAGAGPEGERGGLTGLDRLEELFECRSPERQATLARVAGVVRRDGDRVWITSENEEPSNPGEEHGSRPGRSWRVRDGDRVARGEALTDGPVSPRRLLALGDGEAVESYLLEELQRVYREYGIGIESRHIEVVLSRLLQTVEVVDSGDTGLTPGQVVDRAVLGAANERLLGRVRVSAVGESDHFIGQLLDIEAFEAEAQQLQDAGKTPPDVMPALRATGRPRLPGLTRAIQRGSSFLAVAASPASDPARVLMRAALAGSVDPLEGLTENVMLGRLIPAGTGFVGGQADTSAEGIEELDEDGEEV